IPRLGIVFFFSSRRRHTRFSRDWSSDVCSSDLQLSSLLPSKKNTSSYRRGDAIFRKTSWALRIMRAIDLYQLMSLFGKTLWPSRSEERRVGKECRSGSGG